ncbi:MAG: IS66 family insertion sequence element accessory protein TnpB [Bacteroides thetaiotaomicron]
MYLCFSPANVTWLKFCGGIRTVFILYQKRLEEGTFEVPRFNPDTGSYELSWKTFLLIMQGVSLRSAKCRKRFRLK